MKMKDIYKLSIEELENKLDNVRSQLLNLRLRKKTGQIEKMHMFFKLRKDIARILTVMKLKQK
jgi:large subunit ribosomal protein L29